jgi:PAS domain-containing protein
VVEDVRNGRPLSDGYFEAEHYRKDGSRLWTGVRYSARCDEAGKPVGVQGITIDIGEQKRIQAELAFKNVLLRTQQEVSLDGILAVDADNKVILRNQRFNEMWYLHSGISDTEDDNAVLHTVMDLVADPEAFLERVLYLYSQRQEKSRDEILMKDGRVFDRYSAPMIGPDGQYFGRVWYFRDITEHKEADEMLRKSEERYRKLFENLAQENPQAFESMLKSH